MYYTRGVAHAGIHEGRGKMRLRKEDIPAVFAVVVFSAVSPFNSGLSLAWIFRQPDRSLRQCCCATWPIELAFPGGGRVARSGLW